MNWKLYLISFLSFFCCLFSVNAKEKIKCTRYLNNSDVTICECVKIKDKVRLMDCIEKQQNELLEFIHNSDRYTTNLNGEYTDLGFYDWAITELKYINSLEYKDEIPSRVRRILYNQNVIQTGMSFLTSRGILFGGGNLSPYVEIIQKYNPKSLEGYSLEKFKDEEPPKEYAVFVEEELRNILDIQIDLFPPLLQQSQIKWMKLFTNHIDAYKRDGKLVPGELAHYCIVLDYLRSRIILLSEYANADSDMTWQRLFDFQISELELYELMTDKEVEYEG